MKVAILVPVFNDWESFQIFLENVNRSLSFDDDEVSIVAVNDGSIKSFHGEINPYLEKIFSLEIIDLLTNLGHQRAIAVGLSYLYKRQYFDAAIVCDADGEDRPEDIARLLSAAKRDPHSLVVSQRTQRSESLQFRIFYHIYKIFFKVLTGKNIDFGNFCLIPKEELGRIVYMPELWNHLAASLVKAKIPLIKLPTNRGKRYTGSSKMNLPSLVIHGMGAISVFIELLLVRILIGVSAVGIFSLLIGAIAIFIKLATTLAIPGWATVVLGIVSIVFLQSLILSLISIFMMLSLRSTSSIIPATYALTFIDKHTKVY